MDATLEELEITYLFHKDEEDKIFQRWESILGTVWSKEDVVSIKGGEASEASVTQAVESKIRYPLSLLIRPEIYKELQTRFGEGNAKSESLSVGKEEFIRRMGLGQQFNQPAETGSSPNGRQNTSPFTQTSPYSLGRR